MSEYKCRTSLDRVQAGLTLIEVLVSVVILLVGLLGLAALMASSQKAESESYQRAQALLLLRDMVERINANRGVAECYAITTDVTAGTPYLGVGADLSTIACGVGSTTANERAVEDITEWSGLLDGATETAGGNVGAMVGARGCVTLDNAATRTYTVSVAWQGMTPTKAPDAALNCGKDLYGDEKLRRIISVPLRLANLE
jgi:type IV pilus assembly protein PilV